MSMHSSIKYDHLKPRCIWIDYKGHRILSLDLSNLNELEYFWLMKYAHEFTTSSKQTNLRILTNLKNTPSNPRAMKDARESAKTQTFIVKKNGIYGVSYFQSLLLNMFVKFTKKEIRSFSTKEEALNYLVKD